MSSLWTPSGEHKVPRGAEGVAGDGDSPPGGGGGPGHRPGGGPPGGGRESGGGGPDEPRRYRTRSGEEVDEETLARLEELRAQLLEAPPEDVIANHAYGLFELAALHLSNQPPRLPAASLAIDALGALVDGLGDRLGQHAPSLRDGLAQIRVAFVQITDAASAGDGAPRTAAAAAPSSGEDGAGEPEGDAG